MAQLGLPRVPIVMENNAIDGPVSPFVYNPLDLSYWPDLLADIQSFSRPPPFNDHYQFPYSTFHAPSVEISVAGGLVSINGGAARKNGTTTTTRTTTTAATTTATSVSTTASVVADVTTTTASSTTTVAPLSLTSTPAADVPRKLFSFYTKAKQ